jgi:hypothetical protein
VIIEIFLRMLESFFSKAGGILLLGFFIGSLTVVHFESYSALIEFISLWFIDGVTWFLGISR